MSLEKKPAPRKAASPGLDLLKAKLDAPPLERKKLSPEAKAKVNAQRIRYALSGRCAKPSIAFELVARDLGVSVDELKKSLGL